MDFLLCYSVADQYTLFLPKLLNWFSQLSLSNELLPQMITLYNNLKLITRKKDRNLQVTSNKVLETLGYNLDSKEFDHDKAYAESSVVTFMSQSFSFTMLNLGMHQIGMRHKTSRCTAIHAWKMVLIDLATEYYNFKSYVIYISVSISWFVIEHDYSTG
ncbi:hypothetical protein RIF29_33352 [Crotalaria pallida]|uniref:Uncharacterized protein n=1 Tax=Crotalaria pallida TaxID=3830 RepID=A0AAN9HSQ2_CROPI